jgi:hypothetical protein
LKELHRWPSQLEWFLLWLFSINIFSNDLSQQYQQYIHLSIETSLTLVTIFIHEHALKMILDLDILSNKIITIIKKYRLKCNSIDFANLHYNTNSYIHSNQGNILWESNSSPSEPSIDIDENTTTVPFKTVLAEYTANSINMYYS